MSYKSIYKMKEEDEKEKAKAKKSIKSIIETDWGGSNDSQYKNIQMMSGLAGNDSDIANKFLKAINDFTSKLRLENFK